MLNNFLCRIIQICTSFIVLTTVIVVSTVSVYHGNYLFAIAGFVLGLVMAVVNVWARIKDAAIQEQQYN